MADKIDDIFGDLPDYPGKRKPVGRQKAEPKAMGGPQPLDSWDDHPRVLKLKGVDTEFFTIRNVALALNRSARTVRTWERKKVLPPASFRSPRPRHGSEVKVAGDRLWTRPQVEAMVRVAREEQVLDGRPPGPRFTAKLVQAFLALQQLPSSNT